MTKYLVYGFSGANDLKVEFDNLQQALDLAGNLQHADGWTVRVTECEYTETTTIRTGRSIAIYAPDTNWTRIRLTPGVEPRVMYLVMEKSHDEHRPVLASTNPLDAAVLVEDMQKGNPDFAYYIKSINVF